MAMMDVATALGAGAKETSASHFTSATAPTREAAFAQWRSHGSESWT
jgi:hypothetical protein